MRTLDFTKFRVLIIMRFIAKLLKKVYFVDHIKINTTKYYFDNDIILENFKFF